MNKLTLGSAIALALTAGVSNTANAALASDAVLDFADGQYVCPIGGTYPNCNYGVTNVPTGSYFGMDTSGDKVIQNGEKNAITSAGTGVTLGTAQGVGDIDNTWSFGGNLGNHYTQAGLTVASAAGNTASIDMTGWTVFWNGGNIDMGQGTDGTDHFANVTCAVDCSAGDSFVLDYAAIVPDGGFKGFFYTLHLEGTIGAGSAPSAVPVPAAVWLFGSGILGLAGVARRRKAA